MTDAVRVHVVKSKQYLFEVVATDRLFEWFTGNRNKFIKFKTIDMLFNDVIDETLATILMMIHS